VEFGIERYLEKILPSKTFQEFKSTPKNGWIEFAQAAERVCKEAGKKIVITGWY